MSQGQSTRALRLRIGYDARPKGRSIDAPLGAKTHPLVRTTLGNPKVPRDIVLEQSSGIRVGFFLEQSSRTEFYSTDSGCSRLIESQKLRGPAQAVLGATASNTPGRGFQFWKSVLFLF